MNYDALIANLAAFLSLMPEGLTKKEQETLENALNIIIAYRVAQ